MIPALPAATGTRLEKAAVDNGFDQELPCEPGWLGFASSQAPLRLWLTSLGSDLFLVAFSQRHVADALGDYGTALLSPLPEGATAGRTVIDIPALHRLVRRAFQLSRTLPDELLHTFEKETASLPRTTEIERQVIQRVGQDLFRDALLEYWEGRCAITGLAVPQLLRASHIKPWADCGTDAERLDVFNGLLLAPHLDLAFDRGFITIAEDRRVVLSPELSQPDLEALAFDTPLRVVELSDKHRRYLEWHRERVFRSATAEGAEDS